MLTHFQRKLLRMLFNIYRTEPAFPDLVRLSRISGRSRKEIEVALRALCEKRYIEWSGEIFRVVRPWEEKHSDRSISSVCRP